MSGNFVMVLLIVIKLSYNYCAPDSMVIDDSSYPKVVRSSFETSPNGDYKYGYILENGNIVDVEGNLKEVNGNQVYEVKGFYSYKGSDGKIYSVRYIANENGSKVTEYTITSPDVPIFASINPKAIGSILG